FLLCRKCGHQIAQAQHLFSMPSNMALRQRNDTIVNSNRVLIQLFKNPQEVYFELVTSLHAELESDLQ
ncbi:protein cereblon, partial [Biomphalaria glabrata]